jgi:hypothetical protein
MSRYKYPKGTRVYVPTAMLPNTSDYTHALIRVSVERNTARSIVVTPPGGSATKIASSRAHPANLGLLVIRVGDLQSESGVLDPLAHSVLEFFRLLLADDQIELLSLRTLQELKVFWARRRCHDVVIV